MLAPEVPICEIADLLGYFIGCDGSLWSFDKKPSRGGWRKLKPQRRSKKVPYLAYGFWCSLQKKRVFRYIHRLVLEAFVGPCPEGMQCCHGNGVPTDNRLENLCWGTCLDNHLDTARHERLPHGSRHWKAKLTEADVLEIYRLSDEGWTQAAMAKRFHVPQSSISRIVHGQIWIRVFKQKGD